MNEQPANDINCVNPTSLSHLVGQVSVVEQIKVAIDAAQMDGEKMDSALLVGPPGMGKTAFAHVVAQEMAAELHEVLGQSVRNPADLNAILLSAKNKDVIHIDECHQLGKEYQTALYLAIDQGKLVINGNNKPQTIPIADFTLLLSTTDEYRLLQPLRDRMKLTLRFDFYSEEELTTVVRHRSRGLQWDVDDMVVSMIAERSRGTPRIALRLLQACRRVCRAEGETQMDVEHLMRACGLEQIDNLGLGATEQKYLNVVSDGATRLNVIASMLGLPARTVSQVVEPFLVRIGLLVKDDQGRRQLTEKGQMHLSYLRSCDD